MTARFVGGMSFSAWEVFENCRARFMYEKVLKLPTADKAFFANGRRAHSHLEAVVRDGVPIDPTIVRKEIEFVKELAATPAPKTAEEKWGFTNTWMVTGYREAMLRVVIDVRVDYDIEVEIIDWKTGGMRSESEDQMSLSATATFHRYPFVEIVTTRLVYVEKGGQTIKDHYRRDLADMTQMWEQRFAEVYRETTWRPTPNEWCRMCDFSRAKGGPCRYG
jgi:RecB family exonuclease